MTLKPHEEIEKRIVALQIKLDAIEDPNSIEAGALDNSISKLKGFLPVGDTPAFIDTVHKARLQLMKLELYREQCQEDYDRVSDPKDKKNYDEGAQEIHKVPETMIENIKWAAQIP